MSETLQIIECPRDAMQGMKEIIPTAKKIEYINSLLHVGFHTIDFGSFVSPVKMPQMADTVDVLMGIERTNSISRLLAIVPNYQGAQNACNYEAIDDIGYPFSISETFQLRNTNKTILESIELVDQVKELCNRHHKNMIVYLSMCFGNPYGDTYNLEIINYWVNALVKLGIQTISLSDTIGVADAQSISSIFSMLKRKYPNITFGVHLHTRAELGYEKIDAAYKSGCRRFDGAMKGFGGCPMAKDELVGNMPTEIINRYLLDNSIQSTIDQNYFASAFEKAGTIFS